jgi:putative membrane protein
MAALYPWFKALHIVSVIAWMAAMLYLPRLFVYHAGVPAGSDRSEMLKVMEGKLYRFIMRPAMLATLFFGAALLSVPGLVDWGQFWIYGKLALVLGLLATHGAMGGWRRAFAEDRNTHSSKFFRMMNEVPTVLMIVIVILVVVKPF